MEHDSANACLGRSCKVVLRDGLVTIEDSRGHIFARLDGQIGFVQLATIDDHIEVLGWAGDVELGVTAR